MARPENLLPQKAEVQTPQEALRAAALDLAQAWSAGLGSKPFGALASLASIDKELPEIRIVDIAGKIKDLADERFPVREKATTDLERMGASALPQLLEAEKSPDLEVAHRASGLLGKLVYGSNPEVESRISTPYFSWLGMDVDIARQTCERFDKAINDIDGIAGDPAKVQTRLVELQAVKAHMKLDEDAAQQVERQIRELKNISKLSGEARLNFATFLTGQGKTEVSKQLLCEAPGKYPQLAASHDLMKTACKAAVDQDPKFVDAFVKAGGNIDELKRVKEEKPLTTKFYNGARDSLQSGVQAIQTTADQLKENLKKIGQK